MKRLRRAVLLVTAISGLLTAAAFAQQKPKIVTGGAAAQAFQYNGQSIHPFCLDFPLEASSRKMPADLTNCTDRKVVPQNDQGRLSAEYPHPKGEFFISLAPYISYVVLAAKGDRFLVETEHSGGGSGQFTDLFWVRLDSQQLAVVKDVTGGDRCAGQLSEFHADGSAIRFDQSLPAADVLALTDQKLDAAITDKLRYGYGACDGAAHYRYDLGKEMTTLISVTLANLEPAADADLKSPQGCFDNLVLQYAKARRTTLKKSGLQEFGRKFRSACAAPEPSVR